MNKRYRIITLLVTALLLSGIYISSISSGEATIPVIKQDSLSGKLEINKERYILVNGKTKLQLAIIPPAAMDSLDFHPQANDTLTVTGINNRGIVVVHNVWWKGQQYAFRDIEGKPAWKGIANWKSDAKKCIGCRMCYNNCPADAITMVNNKAVIDQSKCTGCNTCIVGNINKFAGCPVKAITK